MTATQEISRRITSLVASGMELKAAFDAVLGEGSYDRLAGQLYDELRAAK